MTQRDRLMNPDRIDDHRAHIRYLAHELMAHTSDLTEGEGTADVKAIIYRCRDLIDQIDGENETIEAIEDAITA